MRRIGFTRFSRWGDNMGRISVSSAKHTDALDGTDELSITCSEDIAKGDRIVWIDLQGVCHEHIVDTVDRSHDDDGDPETKATCINSVNETWDDWIDDKRPSGGVSDALESILSGTRWEVGTCDQAGNASRTFYHESVREGLAGIVETWGGELETLIVHDGAGIVGRRVGVRAKRGNQNSAKRFTWTKDLVSVKRSVASDNPATRVYGYGKGVETDGGGYGRRLTFGDINGGKDYVEDVEATAVWGHPDGEGGVLPAVASYVNEQCEDASQLLAETQDYLERAKEPKVTYTASVIDLYAFGRSWEGVGVGDAVAIIDKGFSDEGVRLRGRVSKIERDLLTYETTVTFGTLTDSMADMWQSVSSTLKGQSQHNAVYDAAAGTSVSWLQQLQAALNAQFNAVGTYKVETFELGTMWSNVPIDAETGLPIETTSGMWAVNINGMGMRLASSLGSDGQWDWKTFLTGGMVNADAINAGTLSANRVKTGSITGNNISIDLDNGKVTIKKGSIQSSNGNLDIDIDLGTISVVNSDDEGVFFKDGELQLTSKSFFNGNDNAMYGEIVRDDVPASGTDFGISVQGATGAAIKSSNSSASSISHISITGYEGKGAACLVNSDGEASLVGEKSFTLGTSGAQFVSSGINGTVQIGNGLYVWGDIDALKDIHCIGDLGATGNLSVVGRKSAVVPTSSGMRLMYAYELTENWFGDIGFGSTDDDCVSEICIDSVFLETVNTEQYEYIVFLSAESDARVWVSGKRPGSFTVASDKPNVPFGWEIKARRRDFEKDRMEISDIDLTSASKSSEESE